MMLVGLATIGAGLALIWAPLAMLYAGGVLCVIAVTAYARRQKEDG